MITYRTLKMRRIMQTSWWLMSASDCQRLLKWHDYSNTCQVHRALLTALPRANRLIADPQSSQREVNAHTTQTPYAASNPSRAFSFGNCYFLKFLSSLSLHAVPVRSSA